jgi:hypothetical protein
MNRKTISISGAVAIMFGCFLPLLQVSIVGGIPYIRGTDGQIVLVFGLIGLILSLFNCVRFVAVFALLSSGTLIYDWMNFYTNATVAAAGNSVAQAMLKVAQPDIGTAVISLGIGLMIVASFMPVGKHQPAVLEQAL